MARSIDPQPKAARGFIPARTDEERYLMRHIEDLAHTAFSRDIARYSAFLSDREQDLARAALGRAGKVLDMPHEKALFIGAGRNKAPDCMNDRINRTRHCSPARPAGHP